MFINFFFLEKVFLTFIRGKNSANYYFVVKNEEFSSFLEKDGLVFNEDFTFFKNIFQEKKSTKMYFFLFGRMHFLKYQSWVIIYMSIYRPITKKATVNFFENQSQLFTFFEKKKQQLEFF